MTRELRGLPAAPGVALAAAWRYPEPAPTRGPGVQESAEAAAASVERAIEEAATELRAVGERLREGGSLEEADVIEAQALLARDPQLVADALDRVAAGIPPADAVLEAGERAARAIEDLDDPVISRRAVDVRDVARRIARAVSGEPPATPPPGRWIVVADDLPPSALLDAGDGEIAGIALERGAPAAHVAILARGLGVPAVVGVPGLLDAAAAASRIEVDGSTGRVVIDPPGGASRHEAATTRAGADLPNRDDDAGSGVPVGVPVTLKANVDRPDDVTAAVAAGAAGIGLVRTEHLLTPDQLGDAEAQTAAYRRLLDLAGELPVAFRLLDLGGDKPAGGVASGPNPALGLRGMRLARRSPDAVRVQLRALFAAAQRRTTPLQLLAPMVADVGDLAAFRELVEEAAGEAARGGGALAAGVELGVMVEVPSAVLLADRLARDASLLSIGTNDLAQYLLAADRTDPAMAEWHDPLHPAVLRAVWEVVQAGTRHSATVGVCGELAGDAAGAVVLAGLGVQELSMQPAALSRVRAILALATPADASALAARCLELDSGAAVRAAAAEVMPAR